MTNDIITINHHHFGETTVKVVRETAKAVLLAGNASEAWFPKSAIDSDNCVADWVTLRLEHQFLWQAPYEESNPANRIAEMDVSNLTDEQIEVIRQLTLRAEDGFDKRASLADNDDIKNIASSHAVACMRLLGRLREEKDNRTEAA